MYLLQRTAGAFDWGRLLGALEGSAAAPLYLLLTYLDAPQLVGLAPAVLRDLGARQRALGPTTLALLQWLLDRYLMAGPPTGRVLNAYRLAILWQTLLGAAVTGGEPAPGPLALAGRLAPRHGRSQALAAGPGASHRTTGTTRSPNARVIGTGMLRQPLSSSVSYVDNRA